MTVTPKFAANPLHLCFTATNVVGNYTNDDECPARRFPGLAVTTTIDGKITE